MGIVLIIIGYLLATACARSAKSTGGNIFTLLGMVGGIGLGIWGIVKLVI